MTHPPTGQRELVAGRELDALVAEKVMGWTPSGHAFIDERGWLHTIEPTSFGSFQPSTDIAAAWSVLERLEADERRILSEITRRMSTFGAHFIYAVVLRQCTKPFPPNWWSEEATAPLAICVAALKAVNE